MHVGRLLRLAVTPVARRAPDAPLMDDLIGGVSQPDDETVVVLDHAGATTARWSPLRPVAATDAAECSTGRIPRVLDDDEWDAVGRAFAAGALALRKRGRTPIVALDDDGLLHGCLSPLAGPAPVQRALAVVRACAPCDVLVVIEDLAPGGLDATAGVALARALATAAGSTTLLATGGTAHLAPLHQRTKGTATDDVGHFLASAAWCVGRVPWPVVAVGASTASDATLVARARRFGLAGVVRR
jgi:hypothetical protein